MDQIGKYPLGLHLRVFKLGFQTEYVVIIMKVYEVVLIFNMLCKEKLFSFQWPYKAKREVKFHYPDSCFLGGPIQTSISICNSQSLGACKNDLDVRSHSANFHIFHVQYYGM